MGANLTIYADDAAGLIKPSACDSVIAIAVLIRKGKFHLLPLSAMLFLSICSKLHGFAAPFGLALVDRKKADIADQVINYNFTVTDPRNDYGADVGLARLSSTAIWGPEMLIGA